MWTDQPYDRTIRYITTGIGGWIGAAHQARVTRLWSPRYSCTTTKLHYCSEQSLRCFRPSLTVSDSLPKGFLRFRSLAPSHVVHVSLTSKEAESRLSCRLHNDPSLLSEIIIDPGRGGGNFAFEKSLLNSNVYSFAR